VDYASHVSVQAEPLRDFPWHIEVNLFPLTVKCGSYVLMLNTRGTNFTYILRCASLHCTSHPHNVFPPA
jgi:hypothetical protein